MQTFAEMPYGYRWMTYDEKTEYAMADANERQWGWKNAEYVGVVVPTPKSNIAGYVRQWDCMIEFGLNHEHDPVECERIMADMNTSYPDETDYSDWYGGEQGYNVGLRWSDFI